MVNQSLMCSLKFQYGWRWTLQPHNSLVGGICEEMQEQQQIWLCQCGSCVYTRTLSFSHLGEDSSTSLSYSDIKPLFIDVDVGHHVSETPIRFNKQSCMFVPFLDVCWSEMELGSTLGKLMRPFLKYWCNVQCTMPVAWDVLWIIFHFSGTFKSSGVYVIFLLNPDFLESVGRSPPMMTCPDFFHYNLWIIALTTLNFRFICFVTLTDLTISILLSWALGFCLLVFSFMV